MTRIHQLTLSRKAEAVPAARRSLQTFGGCLEAGALYDASLCLSELVANAVLHPGPDSDGEMHIEIAFHEGHMHVAVVNTGKAFEPDEPVLEAGRVGGLGLFIVASVADRWGVDGASGTKVWFEIELDAAAVRSAPAGKGIARLARRR